MLPEEKHIITVPPLTEQPTGWDEGQVLEGTHGPIWQTGVFELVMDAAAEQSLPVGRQANPPVIPHPTEAGLEGQLCIPLGKMQGKVKPPP